MLSKEGQIALDNCATAPCESSALEVLVIHVGESALGELVQELAVKVFDGAYLGVLVVRA